jgi:hypothetical protein
MILLATGRPTTAGLCMRGQRSQRLSAEMCLPMAVEGITKKGWRPARALHPLQKLVSGWS